MSLSTLSCQRLFYSLGFALLSVFSFSGCDRAGTSDPAYRDTVELSYSFQVRNTTRRVQEKAKVILYLPLADTSSHSLLNYQAAGIDKYEPRVYTDAQGNRVMELTFQSVPATYSEPVSIQASVGIFEELQPSPSATNGAEHSGELSESAAEVSLSEREKVVSLLREFTPEQTQAEELQNGEATEATASSVQQPLTCLQKARSFVETLQEQAMSGRAVVGVVFKNGKASELDCWPEVNIKGVWTAVDLDKQELFDKSAVMVGLRVIESSTADSALEALMHTGYGLNVSPMLLKNGKHEDGARGEE